MVSGREDARAGQGAERDAGRGGQGRARTPAIELHDAQVRLGGRTIWSGVEVAAGHGELIAVLGPNGAGKSTLLQVLLGAVPLSRGTATVLGSPPGARDARIGFLPQRRVFDSGTRIRGIDIVRLGLDGSRWGMPVPGAARLSARARARAARVSELIEMVGAREYANRPIDECSGGEQQRLLIAQALAHRPELLLLDEPLDGLDLTNQAAVTALVKAIATERNVTVLLVAHDVNPLLPHLDRVIYLAGGRAAVGTPSEVITSPTLSALYGVDVEVLRTGSGRMVVVGAPEAPHAHGRRHPLADGAHGAGAGG